MTESRRPLRDIAVEMGTDKQGPHRYADAYEHHLGHLRDRPIRLLEIGIGGYAAPDRGGESLRMWKAFFPRGQILGLDLHDKSGLAEDRITILRGDQSDAAFLEALASEHGPFDVVIDDGSHLSEHVITSFRALFPHLVADGIYAIEDLQTSYWERGYGGSSGPDRRGTSMTFLQTLVDGLNYAEFDLANYEPTTFDRQVRSLSFYHNLAFIQKGDNLDPSNVLPPHPRPAVRYALPAPPPPLSRAGQARRWARRVIPRPVRAVVVGIVRAGRQAVRQIGGPASGR